VQRLKKGERKDPITADEYVKKKTVSREVTSLELSAQLENLNDG